MDVWSPADRQSFMDSWSPADIMVNLAELLMDVNFLADMKSPMHIQSPADMKVELKRSSIPFILNLHSLEFPPLPRVHTMLNSQTGREGTPPRLGV